MKIPEEEKVCCICGKYGDRVFEGKRYCRPHQEKLIREKWNKERRSATEVIREKDYLMENKEKLNRYYDFPEDNVSMVKAGNDLYMIDLEDKELVETRNWRSIPNGYAAAHLRSHGIPYDARLHRFIYISDNPEADVNDNTFIDHINGNTYNCTKENIRASEYSASNLNKNTKGNKYGYRGVQMNKHRGNKHYTAQVVFQNTRYRKDFETAKEAGEWYENKCKELYGDLATSVYKNEEDTKYNELANRVKSAEPAIHFNDPKLEKRYNFTEE